MNELLAEHVTTANCEARSILALSKSKSASKRGSREFFQAMCPFADEDTLWLRLVSAYESKLIICGSCGHVEGISDEDHHMSER
eukprot:4096157-Amphidinium_carterae.1